MIIKFYKLPLEGQYLYWSLLFSFFLSSLKTIPSILLERKIKFQKIVFVQVIENTVFYCTVIIMAVLGLGLTSFTLGVILRAIIGLVAIYWLSPWKIEIGIDKNALKKLLSFGVPFQMSSFLALVKDDLLTLYLGKVLGFQALGYIGWAKKWAESPIRIIMDSLSRVLFPVISLFQEDKERLKKVIEKSIYYQSAIVIPSIFGLAIIMGELVNFIPKYIKWAPALPLFYLFCISALFSSYSTPFINLFNGLGKAKLSFVFMVVWTTATWILTPVLTHVYGSFGFPITLVILSSSFIIVVGYAKKILKFSFLDNVSQFFISSLAMTAVCLLLASLSFPKSLSLILIVLGGIITYLFTLRLLFKINFLKELKEFTK
jgi:O-antigen/teichoic acid export membrane protein